MNCQRVVRMTISENGNRLTRGIVLASVQTITENNDGPGRCGNTEPGTIRLNRQHKLAGINGNFSVAGRSLPNHSTRPRSAVIPSAHKKRTAGKRPL